jgi:membrane-bound lytic murein transglycosylase MltF
MFKPNVGDIHQEDANIHADIKYFHSMVEKNYGNEPGMDDLNKILFTFAAYNCGPGRMRQLRAEATAKGYNPNVWTDNVEIIVAERIGAETRLNIANCWPTEKPVPLVSAHGSAGGKLST